LERARVVVQVADELLDDFALEETGPRLVAIEQRHAMPARNRVVDLFGTRESGAAEDQDVERCGRFGFFGFAGRNVFRVEWKLRKWRQAECAADRGGQLEKRAPVGHGRAPGNRMYCLAEPPPLGDGS